MKIDLDVATPNEVSQVLRNAAQAYIESHSELQSAWSDPTAGRIWPKIAGALERAAKSVDNIVAKEGYVVVRPRTPKPHQKIVRETPQYDDRDQT